MKREQPDTPTHRPEGNRRAELLQAAARLMRHKGYASTTIRDMADAVGMSSGSPFCHFRNKQEILHEVAVHGMNRVLNEARGLAERRLPPSRRLRELIRLHSESLLGESGDYTVVMLREWPQLSEHVRGHLETQLARYESIWRECIDAMRGAEHLKADSALSVRLMLGCLNGSLHWFPRTGAMDSRGLADAVAAAFLAAPAGDLEA